MKNYNFVHHENEQIFENIKTGYKIQMWSTKILIKITSLNYVHPFAIAARN